MPQTRIPSYRLALRAIGVFLIHLWEEGQGSSTGRSVHVEHVVVHEIADRLPFKAERGVAYRA